MSEGAIMILCAVIGSGAATAIVSYFVRRREEKDKKETGENQGIRWLLQDRLEHLARHYLADGVVTYEEMRNWNRGHTIYHEILGGNGDLDNVKTALKQLYMKGRLEK